MLTKSSKSLSRKELLQEYSKLRDLYEVQRMELRAKNEQLLALKSVSGERDASVAVDGNVDNPKFRRDTLIAIEANIKQRFESERLEMIEKLRQLRWINVRLVERITLMLKARQRADSAEQGRFPGVVVDPTKSLDQSKHNGCNDPAMAINAA